MLKGMSRDMRGVTIIEVAIALAILGFLMAQGIPMFVDWIQNTQIRTAAEAVQNGLFVARNEALRRNTNVEFVLTAPGTSGGSGWEVRIANTAAAIQSKPGGEGSKNVVLTTTPADATTVTFNGFGRIPTTPPNNADGSPFLLQVDIDVPASVLDPTRSRELRIFVSGGGQIRMCDPNVYDTADPRSC